MSSEHRIKDGQLLVIRRLIGEVIQEKAGQLYIAERLIGRKVLTLAALTQDDWRRIRDEAYPRWKDDEWECSAAFTNKLCRLRNEYLEKALGQRRMF